MYSFLLMLHILGAIGLFAGATCEMVGLWLLRQACSVEYTRAAAMVTRLALVIDPLSCLLVFGTGLYFVITAWGWSVAWIDVALATFVLITLAAPLLQGRRILAIARLIQQTPDGPVPTELHVLIEDPILQASVQTVPPVAVGLLALMTLRPSLIGALGIIGTALVVGIGATIAQRWGTARSHLTSKERGGEKVPSNWSN
jgi:hypothetical protein